MWAQNGPSTTLFFVIPKSITCETPVALLPVFERWVWFGVPEVSEWKSYNKMTCGVCSTCLGGAEIAAWEPRLEMERFCLNAGQQEQGCVSLVVDCPQKNIRECPVGGRVAVGHFYISDGKKQVIKYGKAGRWSQWTQEKNPQIIC